MHPPAPARRHLRHASVQRRPHRHAHLQRLPALGDMTGATVHLAGSWVANSASADGAALVQ
ncbi:hypothetical protein [Streptomyces guryensis]|uniref:Uncharacterized protein n=1 Tax=Streptomyces guryensis TaxID=2886947 RepID=A0A9Q3VPY2_9ACTN|nr:hypothetical protein [Streptomyces guryensis]MCD9876316.1 hypothetical protein [Streptomyces guryensis]